MKQLFECNNSGELVEYIGNKVQLDKKKIGKTNTACFDSEFP